VDAANCAQILDEFDSAWKKGQVPRIEAFVPATGHAGSRRGLLAQLAVVDLEHRWRNGCRSLAGDPRPEQGPKALGPRLEDYVARYPELGPLEQLPLELIGEEYLVRHHHGDRPSHAEYLRRFPWHRHELMGELARIDQELAIEDVRSPATRATPVASSADLAKVIQQFKFLSAAQEEALTHDLQARFAEPRALARELLQRQWLTAYQVNQLLQGRGAELLLGPYVLLERLGEGGAGQVFKGRHRKMGRAIAVKVIRKELLTDAEVVGRFYREIQVLSRLDHPNIVHAYDAGPAAGTHFLAMEFVEGSDLGKLVKQGGRLPVLQACEYVRQAALGLQHAHEKGLVHRDIKPHNLIMSVRDGLVKVADLGLARLPRAMNAEVTAALSGVKGSGTLTPENAVMMGTADYLAPEQALDFHAADIRADIYSLGCTFHYLLTGQPPFPGATLAEKLIRHQQAEPPPLATFRNDVPAKLESVVRKMLTKKPADRFQTPGEVASLLVSVTGSAMPPGVESPKAVGVRPAHAQEGGVASRRLPLGRFVPRFPRTQRRRWLILLMGSGLMVLLGAIVLWLLTFGRSPLDRLDPAGIPDGERLPGQPKELVAVLGENRGRQWVAPDESQGRDSGIDSLALAPDGTVIQACKDGTLRRWDPATGKERILQRESSISGVALSHDGRSVAYCGSDTVRLVDVATGNVWATLNVPHRHVQVAYSPDGKTVASRAGIDISPILWDVATRKPRATLDKHQGFVHCMAYSPNGKILACTGGVDVRLWNTATGTELGILKGQTAENFYPVAFSPDNTLLAAASNYGTVTLWDWADKKERPTLKGHDSTVFSVAFAPDGQTIASAGKDGRVILWDVASGNKRQELSLPGSVWQVAYFADSRHLATVNGNGTAYILRLAPPPGRKK
jgi:tRNA A-37 threonylcarbamoyl transferase component Bud32